MLSMPSIWWPWGVTIVGSFVLSQVMGIIRALKRSQNMATTALQLGLSYSPWIGPESAPRFETALFQNGSSTALKNALTGKYAGLDVQVFDYSPTTGNPGSTTTSAQTVAVYSQNVDLPVFALAPPSLAGAIVDALQHQKVDLDYPSADGQFAVHGSDKDKIRALFSGSLVSFLGSLGHSKGWHIEGAGRTLVVYRYGYRVKPAELRDFLQETSSIAQSFFAGAAGKTAFAKAGTS
jgi:hypothetical protein